MKSVILGAYGVSFSYDGVRQVVREVSFELEEGEILALLGPNGCGKSTLLKATAGILPMRRRLACEGQVRLRGVEFLSQRVGWRARQLAYVGHQLSAEFPLTSQEAVLLGRTAMGGGLLQRMTAQDREAVQWAMEKCLCWDLRDQELHELSTGQRQLVALARALAQGAKVLFLDEALSQMDFNHQAQMGRMLRGLAGEGWSVVLVSHDLNLATEISDACVLMKSGQKVAAGKIRDVINEERIRILYPGADLWVGTNPATGAPKVFFGKC